MLVAVKRRQQQQEEMDEEEEEEEEEAEGCCCRLEKRKIRIAERNLGAALSHRLPLCASLLHL